MVVTMMMIMVMMMVIVRMMMTRRRRMMIMMMMMMTMAMIDVLGTPCPLDNGLAGAWQVFGKGFGETFIESLQRLGEFL
eukprot:582345-Karenia_brevis.AAC.1